jgi:hypothetical protein
MKLTLAAILLLSGCATQAVRCDAHLVPINPPAAKSVTPAGEVP